MGGGLENHCVGRVYGADGAVYHPQRFSRPPPIQKLGAEAISCNSTSNASDDGCMRPKHVELRIHQ